jgi:hypothetical protein
VIYFNYLFYETYDSLTPKEEENHHRIHLKRRFTYIPAR